MAQPNHYKLTYFYFRGRGEMPRMIFAYAGVEYEDHRIDYPEWEAELKEKSIFGFIPELEINGKHRLSQTKAISRYLAEEFGLTGKNPIDRAKANMYVDVIHDDIIGRCDQVFMAESDEQRDAILKKELPAIEYLLERLERELKKNGGKYFVGNELTWADLAIASGFEQPKDFGFQLDVDKYPTLKAHKARVFALPTVAKWVKSRPATDV